VVEPRAPESSTGTFSRNDPQAYWFYNGFSLLAEYIVSSEELARDTHEEKIKNKAWQVSTGYFLTGEDASFKGLSKINQPFAIGKPGWGAFEVAARYGELDVDNDAFAGDAALRFADPTKVASKAKAWTAALNWYPTVNTKVAFNYTDTSFDGGAATGDLDRNNEKAFFTRFQINY
jgi:phosphate-selective porin OprO/OprP